MQDPAMPDVAAIFDKLAATLSHLVADSDVDKKQEAEIQANLKELREFESSLNDHIDARITEALAAAAAAPTPAAGSQDQPAGDLTSRVDAIERGLESLGHSFTDTNTDDVHAPEPADTVAGGSGDDTISASTGDDTLSAGAGEDTVSAATAAPDTLTSGQGEDSATAAQPSDTVAAGEGADTTTAGA